METLKVNQQLITRLPHFLSSGIITVTVKEITDYGILVTGTKGTIHEIARVKNDDIAKWFSPIIKKTEKPKTVESSSLNTSGSLS